MGERYNSGSGGYTCDGCQILLWAGVRGGENPEKRIFIYSTKEENIVERQAKQGHKLFYCSEACRAKHEGDHT